jgi:bifunctional DNA-binding transcriptional regulator/antitoxin component of YhaV-PrlF toxin-antitoxin module
VISENQIISGETEDMNRTQNTDPIVSKIVNRWQITVPVEIRTLYRLQEGDVFEWKFNSETSSLTLIPKRAQLITPVVIAQVEGLRTRRAQELEPALSSR